MLLTQLASAGVNFIMGIPGSDDIMLNYQTTSFHDARYVRQLLGLQAAPEFETWLHSHGICDPQGRLSLTKEIPASFTRQLGSLL